MSLSLAAGETIARDVTITNSGASPVVVHVRYSDWTVDPSGAITFLPPGELANSLLGSVQFEPTEFSLQAGESGRVRLAITLPPTGPATRWGVLLSEVRPVEPRIPPEDVTFPIARPERRVKF